MTDFKVVPDAIRDDAAKGAAAPDMAALIAGQTIFVPLNGVTSQVASQRFRSRLKHAANDTKLLRGRKHTLDGVAGVVFWAVDR